MVLIVIEELCDYSNSMVGLQFRLVVIYSYAGLGLHVNGIQLHTPRNKKCVPGTDAQRCVQIYIPDKISNEMSIILI